MPEEPSSDLPALVVIGASAGGIDALSELLGPLDPSFPAPIVIAQHTQPSRTSHLAEILAGRTKLSVVTVERKEPLRPATVYLVPSDHHVLVTDHVVEARKAKGDRPSPSIDRLLATAAEVFGERLIAVILSGMGSDGVVGAGEVKSHGGTVIIQNPETAAQPSMPRSLPPTLVDFVANADRMAELLTDLALAPVVPSEEDDERLLAQFLDRVRDRTGIDFGAYKRPTILRRLQRRMVATSNPRLRDYVRYVQQHPEEYQRISSAFLIKVTQFFRDVDLFEHLRTTLIPELIEEARTRGRELRIWSAGCATGEEAYSLAILVNEVLGKERGAFTVRIFATDLDEEAIAYARRGVYPSSAMQSVPDPTLATYFVREGDHYEVSKGIRSLVVFGQHDLGQRAPFPRIDLALCRNVLIYFTAELQKRALQLFAFSLREGGYLVLGKAESSAPYAEHFILDQPRLKVYRRAGDRVLLPPARGRGTAPVADARLEARREPAWATVQLGGRLPRANERPGVDRLEGLLMRLPTGVVVIDNRYDILFLNAAARRLLGIHGAAIGSDFVHLANELPSEELRAAIARVRGDEEAVVNLSMPVSSDDAGGTHVGITLQRWRPAGTPLADRIVITVTDLSESARDRARLQTQVDRGLEDRTEIETRIERVARTNRELLTANEEMTDTNLFLRTANEDLLIANEEVQAATEEVETLNEELQATNEELETLNEELQATVEELNTTNDDLEARRSELAETGASLAEQRQRSEVERKRLSLILDGMGEAVLVIDASGKTIGTNRAYEAHFGLSAGPLVPEDATGRSLPDDEWPQERAARGETFAMSFTRVDAMTGERRWYEASCLGAGDGAGGVVVIRDITDRSLRHLQERFIDTASHELQTPLAALHNYLQLVERDGTALDGETRRYLQGALEQSRRLGDLAARLFDVSLIRHGRAVIHHDPVDLRDLLTEGLEELALTHPETRVHTRLGSRRAMVPGDSLRLRQVFGNLLVNAATHGSSDEPVDVALQVENGTVSVLVADRGVGLPPAAAGDVFLPFVAATNGHAAGLGLGLYLSHAIVAEHGGTLTLLPRDGGGTVARLTLPRSVEGRPAEARRSRRSAGSGAGIVP